MTSTARLERLRLDYRTAFLRYLPRREEVALRSAYEIGRSAVAGGVSLLDLIAVHHEVLLGVLRESSPEEVSSIAGAAAQFLLDALSTFDMTQRQLFESS